MEPALGDVAGILGTGPYVAELVGGNVSPVLLAPLTFLVSAFIAFSVRNIRLNLGAPDPP